MNSNHDRTRHSLRDDAEEQLARSPNSSQDIAGSSPEQLIHELRVHQIELETQAEELRRSQLALEESRDKFLDLYEFAPVGYLTLNDKALITEANLTCASLLGIERSKLVNHGPGVFIAPESQDAWDLYFANLRQHVEKQICNLTLIRVDGSMFPARLEGVRTISCDGIITVRIAISEITDIWQIEKLRESEERHRILRNDFPNPIFSSKDISERKKAEEALQKSESQLLAILESTADGILAVDNEGKVLKGSRRFAEIWKIPQSIMDYGDDRTLLDFVLGQLNDPDAFLRKVQSLYDSDADDMDTLTFRDGRVFERYTSPMIMDGNRVGRVWSFRDITEHKRMELELKTALASLKEAHHLASIGTWDWIIQTDTVIWSEELYNIVGLDPSQPAPTYTEHPRIYTPASWDFLSNAVTRALETDEPYNLELELVRTDGSIRWINTFGGVKRDENGKIIGLHGTVQDTTKRKWAEESLLKSAEELRIHQFELETQAEELMRSQLALVESRDKFLDLYEFAPIGYLTITDKGLIIEVNLTGATLLGVDRSKLIKARFSKFISEKDSDQWYRYFMQILNQMEKQICNLTLTRGDDSLFHAHLEGVRLTNSEGMITIRIAFSDISGLKHVEEELRESEVKYRSLIESSSDAVFCVDKNGEYKFTNLVFTSTFDKTPDYFIGKTFWDIYPKEHADFRQLANSRMFETGVTQSVEVEVPLHGKSLFFIAKANPIKDETGKVILNLTHATDITERKRAEDALQESESFNRNLIENLPDYIWVSGPDGKILYINPPATNALGYTMEEMNCTSVISYVAEESRDDLISRMDACYEGKKVSPYEIDVLSRDGRRISVMVQGAPIQYRDTPALLLVLTDITSRKQTDDALLQANKKLNILSGITRHDIKNKVLIIQGFLEFAQRLKVIEEIEPILNKIRDSARAIEHQIDFTKDYQDLGVKSPRWLNLSNMIILAGNPAIHIFDETGESGKGARFEITVPNGAWRYENEAG